MSVTISGDTGVSAVQDGVIVQADLATAILPLGVGQTWQNMTGLGGRAVSSDITNTSGRPIQVAISGSLNAAGANIALLVAGVQVDLGQVSTSGYYTKVSAIVPNGAVYRVNPSGGVLSAINWAELR